MQRKFLTEVTGTRVSDHNKKHLYNSLSENTLLQHQLPAISAVAGLQLELISLVVLFSRIFTLGLYVKNTYFQEHLSFCYSFFLLQYVKQEFTPVVSLFIQKSDALYLFSINWVPFNFFFKNFTHIGMKFTHLFSYFHVYQ